MTTRLVLATANEGKARELRSLLPGSFDVVTAATLAIDLPEETGDTFADNARLKAVAVSERIPDLVLADDSGLVVDALDGRPGVRSARYAGDPSSDDANIALLLTNLRGVPADGRTARFVCALCLARTGAVLARTVGNCEGTIDTARHGTSGFGYDPVFVTGDGRTLAELDPDEKNAISHRGAALRAMIPSILRLADVPPMATSEDR